MALVLGEDCLVQMSRLGIKRQHGGVYIKNESSKGRLQRYTPDMKFAFVDWFVDDPWPHTKRQKIRVEYLEPLGTPR